MANISSAIRLLLLLQLMLLALVAANQPPRFEVTDESGGEIVLKLKEGAEGTPVGSVIYRIKASDADGDALQFGLLGQAANELLRVQPVSDNEADLQLTKELDREVNNLVSTSLQLYSWLMHHSMTGKTNIVYFNEFPSSFDKTRRKKSIRWC